MINKEVYSSLVIHFKIDGRQGMLNAELVAKALDIPIAPPILVDFQPITKANAADMVRTVSWGQSRNLVPYGLW